MTSKASQDIKEEIARNYSTRGLYNDKPYDLIDNTDLDVEMFAMTDGRWSAQVKCISKPELSTPVRVFTDEISANFWTRNAAEKITRQTMNENSLRTFIRTVLKEIL